MADHYITENYKCTKLIRSYWSLVADLTFDQSLITLSEENQMVIFNAFKTKLLTVHHHQTNPEFSPNAMNRHSLSEVSYLEHLLRVNPDPKSKLYILIIFFFM